jgi:hypothetical protein
LQIAAGRTLELLVVVDVADADVQHLAEVDGLLNDRHLAAARTPAHVVVALDRRRRVHARDEPLDLGAYERLEVVERDQVEAQHAVDLVSHGGQGGIQLIHAVAYGVRERGDRWAGVQQVPHSALDPHAHRRQDRVARHDQLDREADRRGVRGEVAQHVVPQIIRGAQVELRIELVVRAGHRELAAAGGTVHEHLVDDGEEEPVGVGLLGEHPAAAGRDEVEDRPGNRLAAALVVVGQGLRQRGYGTAAGAQRGDLHGRVHDDRTAGGDAEAVALARVPVAEAGPGLPLVERVRRYAGHAVRRRTELGHRQHLPADLIGADREAFGPHVGGQLAHEHDHRKGHQPEGVVGDVEHPIVAQDDVGRRLHRPHRGVPADRVARQVEPARRHPDAVFQAVSVLPDGERPG